MTTPASTTNTIEFTSTRIRYQNKLLVTVFEMLRCCKKTETQFREYLNVLRLEYTGNDPFKICSNGVNLFTTQVPLFTVVENPMFMKNIFINTIFTIETTVSFLLEASTMEIPYANGNDKMVFGSTLINMEVLEILKDCKTIHLVDLFEIGLSRHNYYKFMMEIKKILKISDVHWKNKEEFDFIRICYMDTFGMTPVDRKCLLVLKSKEDFMRIVKLSMNHSGKSIFCRSKISQSLFSDTRRVKMIDELLAKFKFSGVIRFLKYFCETTTEKDKLGLFAKDLRECLSKITDQDGNIQKITPTNGRNVSPQPISIAAKNVSPPKSLFVEKNISPQTSSTTGNNISVQTTSTDGKNVSPPKNLFVERNIYTQTILAAANNNFLQPIQISGKNVSPPKNFFVEKNLSPQTPSFNEKKEPLREPPQFQCVRKIFPPRTHDVSLPPSTITTTTTTMDDNNSNLNGTSKIISVGECEEYEEKRTVGNKRKREYDSIEDEKQKKK